MILINDHASPDGKIRSLVVQVFPLPILGALLVIEGLRLMLLLCDTVDLKGEFAIAVLVGLIAAGLRYGYLVGIRVGTVLFYLGKNRGFSFAASGK